jgi:hypothetical protein
MLPGMLLNLSQIANSLTEQCEHETFQISGFWADDGLPGNNLCKMALSTRLNAVGFARTVFCAWTGAAMRQFHNSQLWLTSCEQVIEFG